MSHKRAAVPNQSHLTTDNRADRGRYQAQSGEKRVVRLVDGALSESLTHTHMIGGFFGMACSCDFLKVGAA